MFKINYFIVTIGELGLYLYSSIGMSHLQGTEVGVVDVCGAGDTITAITALAYACGVPIETSLELANKAAAETCKHAGVYAIKKEDLLKL